MEFHELVAHLEADAARLSDVAAKGVEAPLPTCPGWTIDDLLAHLAEGYLYATEAIRRGQLPEAEGSDGPDVTDGREQRDGQRLLADRSREVVRELKERGPRAPAATWWPADQTVGFWYRRLAHETAMHRVDVEAAYDMASPVPPRLAADGVDELLMVFLAGDWADHPVEEGDGRVVDVLAGGRIWRITLEVLEVACLEQAPGRALPDVADASISGDSSDVLLWLWGRGAVDHLTITGDQELADVLRRRMELATQ